MIASLLSIKIRVQVIDINNNEIRGGGVERDAGGDETQLIKFAWPNSKHNHAHSNYQPKGTFCVCCVCSLHQRSVRGMQFSSE